MYLCFMKHTLLILLLFLSASVLRSQTIDTISEVESDTLFLADTVEDIEDSEVTKMF